MEELIKRMNVLLAGSYLLYLKASFFHWNVKGPDFAQYHSFLGDFYDEIYSSIDVTAEFIRAMDGVPQNAPSQLHQNSSIKEQTKVEDALTMLGELSADVRTLLEDVMDALTLADRFKEVGVSNFLQDRHAALKKHAWMLKSLTSK